MERIKYWMKSAFDLPIVPTFLLAVPAFALVGYVLCQDVGGTLAYLVYLLSAYAFGVVIIKIVKIVIVIRRMVNKHPLGKRLLGDVHLRTMLSLYKGFAIDVAYIVFEIVLGISERSLWFGFLASYYALLAIMRLLLFYPIKDRRNRSLQEIALRRYRSCGIMLLLMNQSLSGMVIFIVQHNQGYDYPGTLIYAMAAYTFYAVIIAIVHVIKFRKKEPILSAAKAINLVAAMVSMLALETAMLTQFGDSSEWLFRQVMTSVTGACVCTLVLVIAIVIIVQGNKMLKQYTRSNNERKG